MPTNVISGSSCSIYPVNHPTLLAGLPAQEYKHHALKSPTTGAILEIVTIESNEGTAFEIKLEINPSAYSLLQQSSDHPNRPPRQDDYLIYVDLDGISIQRSKRHRSQVGPTIISGVYSTDLKSTRLFQFGKLHLVDPDDNDRICEDEKIIQALGTIQVNVVKCTLLPPQPAPNRGRSTQNYRPSGPSHRGSRGEAESIQTTNQMMFSERSKKACQLNTVGLGKPVPARGGRGSLQGRKNIRRVRNEDPHPFLQFIFKYKPRSILEAEGIIAPPPPPPPSPPRAVPEPKTTKSRQSSVKDDFSKNHDYVSNSELHHGLNGLDDKKFKPKDDQEDEKKPNLRAAGRKYIVVESDSETECSDDDIKRKVIKTESGGRSRGNNRNNSKMNNNQMVDGSSGNGTSKSRPLKVETGGHDENLPQLIDHPASNDRKISDSKKRTRSSPTTNAQSSKRRSSITPGIIDCENRGALNCSTNNKPELSNGIFRDARTNDVYDDSSDDDDTFQKQIIGSNRPSGSKDDSKHSKHSNHSRFVNTDAEDKHANSRVSTTTTTTLITPNGRYTVKDVSQNGRNFVDLTALDSD